MSDLATLQSDVAGALGLDFDSATPTAGDGPRLLGWANDAVIDLLRRTHCFVQTALLDFTVGEGDYRMDPQILAIEDIYLASDGTNYRVERLSTPDLINLRLNLSSSSLVQKYALSGADLLMVYPTPLQADTLTIYYVPKPTALADPTDDPSTSTLGGIPEEFHYGLELYMMWKAAQFSDDESSQSGETYRRLYLGDPTAPPGTEQRDGFCGTMKKDMRRRGGKLLGGITIPPRNRRVWVPNPGVDVGSIY